MTDEEADMTADEQRRALEAFARWVIDEAFEGEAVDGGDVQDMADKLGLIVSAEGGYDPEKHGEAYFTEPGDEWFEIADWLKEPKP